MGPVRSRAGARGRSAGRRARSGVGAAIVLQEGDPGCERLIIPAGSLSPARLVTIGLALAMTGADGALLFAMLSARGLVTMTSGALFLLAVPLTLLSLTFGSEAVRILLGRESLNWEDVFLVHERRLPWSTTTKTLSLSRVEGTAVVAVQSAHPMDSAMSGRLCMAVRTRDGVVRVGVGLPRPELERLEALTSANLTTARLRIGLRGPL